MTIIALAQKWFWNWGADEVGDRKWVKGMNVRELGKPALEAVRPLHERELQNVCKIFEEVTGLPAEATREAYVIQHWLQRGWTLKDFRMVIEFQFGDERQREFYEKPGNLNLRMMLNPSFAERLIDILVQLKYAEKKRATDKNQARRSSSIVLRCGTQIAVGDKHSFDVHMEKCFEIRGACFLT